MDARRPWRSCRRKAFRRRVLAPEPPGAPVRIEDGFHELRPECGEAVKAEVAAALREAVRGADTRVSELLDGPKEPSSRGERGVALSSLSDDLLSFYKEVEKSDGAPTTSQTTAANLLNDKLIQSVKAWDEFKTNELTKLNEKLRSVGLAEIRLDLPPREPEHAHNEE